MVRRRACIVFVVGVSLVLCLGRTAPNAQGRPRVLVLTGATPSELREWDQQIDRMLRTRDLYVRAVDRDTMLPDRRHERIDQYHRGVRISGGDVVRQIGSAGTVSVFGMLHDGIDIDLTPALGEAEGRAAVAGAAGGELIGDVELVVLPLPDGYHLAYFGRVAAGLEVVNVFASARTGQLLRQYSDFVTAGVVGKGRGSYGDEKKVSASPVAGGFVALDELRPAAITTYDMRGNLDRLVEILNTRLGVSQADVAADGDNDWTDGPVVDAHVYSGWFYDYLFRRFGRSGIDDRNLRMAIFTHPVSLQDIETAPGNVVGLYYLNAFFCSTCGPDRRGAVVFGAGAPRGYRGFPFEVKSFSAALDVVAHELSHAVIAATSRLNGFQFSEGGALNEAFADIIGASTEFFHQAAGNGPMRADYLMGEDLTDPPSTFLTRSLANPPAAGSIDHYTRRNLTASPHFNSTVVSHAFYLTIEGGTNATSGMSVQGVGAANREQVERVFFRAFAMLLPSNATFALARLATIQAARDLYGAGGPVERAVTQAWDAVGVQPRTVPTAALNPSPATGANVPCAGTSPSWVLGITASAGADNLRVSGWRIRLADAGGATLTDDRLTPAQFAQFFGACGLPSDRIQAQSDACSAVCVNLGGRTAGSAQFAFDAITDAGQPVSFGTPTVQLLPPRP